MADTSKSGRAEPAAQVAAFVGADRFERETVEILKQISRRPIEPKLEDELLADLGFDSLQVLELIGELESHFEVAVPLNDLSHIRTVAQVVAVTRGLASAAEDRA